MPVVYFADPVYTSIWAIWAEQHAHYLHLTSASDQPERKKNVGKHRAYCPIIYTVAYEIQKPISLTSF